MNFAASRLTPIKPSASAWVSQAAKEAKARGEDIIDLGLGEPDFDTPVHIKEAAHHAAMRGETKYTPTNGTSAMRQAVVNKLKRENDLDYALDEVIVSNGAKQVLFTAFMATLEVGDEVLLCAPYFGQYRDIISILGGVPVPLKCAAEDGFRLQPEQLSNAITAKTRWLLLNQPSNPSGAVYSDDEIIALGAVLQDHEKVLILSDEIYEHILFDDHVFRSFAALNSDLKDRTLTVNGVSKAYAMTGWRIGYGAGAKELISAMTNVQSQISSGACSVAQAAATAALNGPQDEVKRFCAAFKKRRDLVVSKVQQIPGLTLDAPGGAFYGFISCAGLIGAKTPNGETLGNDSDVTAYLLSAASVAAVPGSAYELSPFFRISTAASEEILGIAMDRIAAAVAELEGVTP